MINLNIFLLIFQLIKKMLDHSPKIRPTATSLINTDLHDEGLEENVDEISNAGDDCESDYVSENDIEYPNDSI